MLNCKKIYVSPEGNDFNSGETESNSLQTLNAALKRIHQPTISGTTVDVEVILRGGRYELAEPIRFRPRDGSRIYLKAYPNEIPVITGGRLLVGFEETIHQGRRAWTIVLPEVAAGEWYFRDLYVDNSRRQRPRLPKKGAYCMTSVPNTPLDLPFWKQLYNGQSMFQYAEHDIDANWHEPTDIDILVHHLWVQERMPIKAILSENQTVVSTRSSVFSLREDHKKSYGTYLVENVFEALSEPGEFYLDRSSGRLTYLPLEDEHLDTCTIEAPRINQLIHAIGDAENRQYVDGLSFEGITFQCSGWEQPSEKPTNIPGFPDHMPKLFAGSPQAAIEIPGALQFDGCRNIRFERCHICMTGYYGIALENGTQQVEISHCKLTDLGAGGVKVNGSNADGPQALRCGSITIHDCQIRHGGQVFASAVGILITHGFDNHIAYNEISDLTYSGISAGWVWGYGESVSRDNVIENNHIHHIGGGLISDMGGVYLLGVQPGTIVRGNHIHHVQARSYGGWGIYLDEGAGHIILEENLVHHCSSTGGFIKGRGNIVRNNVFALCKEGGVTFLGDLNSNIKRVIFQQNVVLIDNATLISGPTSKSLEGNIFVSDHNLLYDRAQKSFTIGNQGKDENGDLIFHEKLLWNDWLSHGNDTHSVTADPLFADPDRGDFSVGHDSPIHQLGIKLSEITEVGPRSREQNP